MPLVLSSDYQNLFEHEKCCTGVSRYTCHADAQFSWVPNSFQIGAAVVPTTFREVFG